MTFAKRPDGRLYQHGEPDSKWDFSPLYEEVTTIPLLIHHPEHAPGNYTGLTSVVDVMPTVLDTLGQPLPSILDGRSLMPAVRGDSMSGREFNVSTIPFANPGDDVRSVDNIKRLLATGVVTTVTSDDWALLYSVDPGVSELYDLRADPSQGTQRDRPERVDGAPTARLPGPVHEGNRRTHPPAGTQDGVAVVRGWAESELGPK